MDKSRIMVVEDEGIVAHDIARQLMDSGYDVIAIVYSGETAVVKAGEVHPDLVVMDIVLSGKMDGIEAAEIIRSRWDIPVIFLTAYADQKLLERAKRIYPLGYILKPFKCNELKVTVEMALYISKADRERRKVEEALRQSEVRFDQLATQSRTIAWEVDGQGLYTFVSNVSQLVLGYHPDELVGKKHFYDLHPEEGREAFKKAAFEIFERKEFIQSLVNPIQTKDNVLVWVSTNGFPLLSADGILQGYRGSDTDITERKQAEEEKRILEERLHRAEKMESLGILAGGVAHDLNNVLGVVVGYSEMILDQVDKSSPLRRGLENIMSGGLKAAAIVEDLLTLAIRGVQGRSILNLNKIIADCQKSPEFANLSNHHPSVKIKIDLETDLPNTSGSSVHLGKTFYNLISNASEAMPKGGIVTIKTTNQYLDKPIQGYDQIREGDYVVLAVSDTGEGIPEADLKRIFEPFYTKKIMGRSGTGLGLAVVWGTVKDHNGYINVHSEEGKGSTFTLYFPMTREEITTEAVAVAISEYMGNSESILVVDDVKEQRDLAAGMLRTLNYNVSSVSSGEEAVTYLNEHEVDLMILDMIMDPGMDGLDTFKSILNIRPNQKAIIVSGFSESDRVKTAKDLGASTYVRKPYIKEKLGMAVRKELDRK